MSPGPSERPPGADESLPTGIWPTTSQLRQMAAAAARLRLPWQLDYRLDAVLDPAGTHVLGLFAVLDRDPVTGEKFPEPVARCAAIPKFVGVDAGLAFHLALDVRLSDYTACTPMDFSGMDEYAVNAWHRFMNALKEHPEVFESRRTPHIAGHTAVIAKTGRSPNR